MLAVAAHLPPVPLTFGGGTTHAGLFTPRGGPASLPLNTAANGANVPRMAAQSPRTRGPATGKFTRKPSTGAAHEERVQFGKSWGTFNSRIAEKLRKGSK